MIEKFYCDKEKLGCDYKNYVTTKKNYVVTKKNSIVIEKFCCDREIFVAKEKSLLQQSLSLSCLWLCHEIINIFATKFFF